MLNKFISENRILKALKVPLCLISVDGRIIDYNDDFASLPGIKDSMASAGKFDDLIEEKSRSRFIDRLKSIQSNSDTDPFISELIPVSNNSIKVEITPQLICDEEQNVILLTLKEYTAISELEEELHKSEEKYKQIIKNSPVGMLILVNGKIILANLTLAKTLGYDSEKQLLGKAIIDFITPEYLESAKNRLKILTNGSGESIDTVDEKFIKRDGSVIDVLVAGHSIDYNGEPAIQGYIFDVTESKRMESELRFSEDKFKKAFYTSPDSITISRLSDGTFLDVNEGFIKSSGYSREEALGHKAHDINLWYDLADRDRFVTTIQKAGHVNNLEAKFRIKNGQIMYALLSASVIVLDNEPYILAITRDITNIKMTQFKLEESEERFRSMFENANAIMLLIDPDSGKIIDANQAACRFYGYEYSRLVEDLYIADINKTAKEDRLYALRQSVISGDKFFKFKHQLANKEIRDVEVYSGKVAIGNKTRIYSIIHDVTDRRLVEEENIKLTQAIKQSPASILITNCQGKIEFVNEKVLNVTGYDRDELIGKNPSIFKSGHTSDEEYKKLWETITCGETWRGEFHNKTKKGDYFWELSSISPIKNSEGKLTHFLAIKEDITADKEKTKHLIEAKEKAELSDKLKSEFLAQMSHEIRTPINVILSFTSLLQNEFIDNVDDDTRTIFHSIESSGQRIIRTIDLIINMSELQSGSYEPDPRETFLIDMIINPLLLEYSVLAQKKGLDLIFETGIKDTIINIDHYSTTQIFSNLIDNAIKYTDKGKVTIRIYTDEDYTVTIEVADTGIGISKKYLPELFQPFSQEEQGYTRKYEGNGLGLAIVKKYCELNNADIRVNSTKGKGTIFTVKFPVSGRTEKSEAI